MPQYIAALSAIGRFSTGTPRSSTKPRPFQHVIAQPVEHRTTASAAENPSRLMAATSKSRACTAAACGLELGHLRGGQAIAPVGLPAAHIVGEPDRRSPYRPAYRRK